MSFIISVESNDSIWFLRDRICFDRSDAFSFSKVKPLNPSVTISSLAPGDLDTILGNPRARASINELGNPSYREGSI